MFKTIFIWLFGTLLLLQAIQISIPPIPKKIDPNTEIKVSAPLMKTLRTSCYACHSYKTKMPWYGNIAPISWEVKSHIKEGRAWLNFQEWKTYDAEKKQKIYKGIVKTLKDNTMPMPMYLLIHKDAKLSASQKDSLIKWAESNIKEEY